MIKSQILHGIKYPAIYEPRSNARKYENPLFLYQLKNKSGGEVQWSKLKGMSVCLLFGSGDLRRFVNILPFVINYYCNTNECSDRQKIEIIYVPLDEVQADYEEVRSKMPWLSFDFNNTISENYQQHYRMYYPHSKFKNSFGACHRPPALVNIASDGSTYKVIEFDGDVKTTTSLLTKWDYDNNLFM